jgi:hypothetical protein
VLAEGTVQSGRIPAITLPQLSVGTHDLVIDVQATATSQAASTTARFVLTAEPPRATEQPTATVVLGNGGSTIVVAAPIASRQTSSLISGAIGGGFATAGGTGGGFTPSGGVAAYLHSDPVLLGTVIADANGDIAFSFAIPAGVPLGTHTLILTDLTSGVWAQMTVELVAAPAAPTLAETGAEPGSLLAATWAMIAAGAVLVLLVRRIRTRTAR